jgi:hypothetical protein
MNGVHITYNPHPDATPEAELNALAAAYRFILDCAAKKKNSSPTAVDPKHEEVSDVERRSK